MKPPAAPLAYVAALGLAVLVAFGGSLASGFVSWDDNLYVYANPHIRALTPANLGWMLTNTFPQWGPLAFLCHAFDYALFGLAPAGHHFTSLLLHAASACLVMALLLALLREAGSSLPERARLAGGFAAALFFAVHPLRVESVVWAAEKKDLLCGLFYLLTLLAWLRRSASTTARGRSIACVLAHVFFVLALLSKPMAVTLPAVLLLLDFFPAQRGSLRGLPGLLREKLLFVVLAVAVVWVTLDPRLRQGEKPTGRKLERTAQALVPLRAATFYLQKTLWPSELVPFYPLPHPEQRRFGNPEYALSAVVLVVLTALSAWRWRRGDRVWAAAWAFYLITLLPVSGVAPLSGQMAADRFSYLPTLSFFLLAGLAVARAWARGGRRRELAALAVLSAALLLGSATRAQVRVWEDSWVFWDYVAQAFPGRVAMAHNNLGALYQARARASNDPEDLRRAEAEYRKAIAIFPEHANAYNNLGLIFEERRDLPRAEESYEKALRLAPTHPEALLNLARLRERQRQATP